MSTSQLALPLTLPVEVDPEQTPGLVAALSARVQPRWATAAACAGAPDPDAWFPDFPATEEQLAGPVRVCRHCPVSRACLAAALVGNESGVWGGTTDIVRMHAVVELAAGADLDTTLDALLTDEQPIGPAARGRAA